MPCPSLLPLALICIISNWKAAILPRLPSFTAAPWRWLWSARRTAGSAAGPARQMLFTKGRPNKLSYAAFACRDAEALEMLRDA